MYERKSEKKIRSAVSAQLSLREKQSLLNARTSGRTVLRKVLQARVWSARKACATTGSDTPEKEVASLHEFSIACEIFDQVVATAKANRATEVKNVTLQMGRLSHTNPEQLSFCFNTLAEGSIAENAD